MVSKLSTSSKLKFPSNNFGAQIQLFITLATVAVAIVNFVILAHLSPVSQQLTDFITSVHAYELQNDNQHANFVPASTFNELNDRVDHISTRVDQIYNIVATMKK